MPFGSDAINHAIQRLARPDDKGLIATNESIWDLLRLGLSQPQLVDGRRRSHPMRYIDWDNPSNNEFHVTEEFTVDRRGDGAIKNRRVDLVCFVNGIPFVVIECKSSTGSSGDCKPVDAAISQQLRNQGSDEVPRLFHYAQLVMGLAVNEARYAVTGTPHEYWHRWRERLFTEEQTETLTQARSAENIEELRNCLEQSGYRNNPSDWNEVEKYLTLCSDGRLPTEQDRLLLALCTPARLLEITRWFNLFDEGVRKIARYQQYFCVHKCLNTYQEHLPDGRRKGGIVWHTQGSGKSLTMVFQTEAVTRTFRDESPLVIIVTDRVDLDQQIKGTFTKVGMDVISARSGTHLETLLRESRGKVITTTVHKFDDFTRKNREAIDDDNIFVFVDEGHRTQTGSHHAAMRRALPKACLTGFTGTPILSGDKQTALAFGGIIDTYTIKEAVVDGAVVNLVYEGRYSQQHVDSDPIDMWLAHHTFGLTDEQVQQLKSRYSSHKALNDTEDRIWRQANDISLHFKHVFQSGDTGAKAQLVTQSKAMAIRYHLALEEIGLVSSEVMISGPDTREGHTKVDDP
ncbi:MAG: HsdR family type I site-specific deoxyribonuclease, partial [Phycisphaerales bacterium]|nr:HsdR family type I site-specific deoxyribonuclease [Phycisphaerales bacterium]